MSVHQISRIIESCGVYRVQLTDMTDFRFIPPAAASAIISQAHHDANIEMQVGEGGEITHTFPEANEYALIIVKVPQLHSGTHKAVEFVAPRVEANWTRSGANYALKRIAWCSQQNDPKLISEILSRATAYFNFLSRYHHNGVAGSLMVS